MIGGRTAAGRNRGRTGGRSAGDGGGRSGRGVAWCEPEPWAAGRRRGGCGPCGHGWRGELMQAQDDTSRQQAEGTQEQQPGAASRETGQQPPHQAGTAHHQRERNRQPTPAPTPADRPKITPNAPAPSPARAKSERPRPRKVLLGRRPSLAGSEAQKFFR